MYRPVYSAICVSCINTLHIKIMSIQWRFMRLYAIVVSRPGRRIITITEHICYRGVGYRIGFRLERFYDNEFDQNTSVFVK